MNDDSERSPDDRSRLLVSAVVLFVSAVGMTGTGVLFGTMLHFSTHLHRF